MKMFFDKVLAIINLARRRRLGPTLDRLASNDMAERYIKLGVDWAK